MRPELDDTLHGELVRLWVEVADAGGAVGILPPADPGVVGARVDAIFERAESGKDHLVVARDPSLVGWVVVETNTMPIIAHWAWVKQLMVRPANQRNGTGAALLAGAERVGFDELALDALYLTCRSATGIEDYYRAKGWREVGRMPGNLDLGNGDRRDEVYMIKSAAGRAAP